MTVSRRVLLLAAVDTSPLSVQVLTKAAELARRSDRGDGEVVVLHVIRDSPQTVEQLRNQAKRLLADIRHRFITTSGSVPEEIIQTAQEYGVAEIIMGKRGHRPLADLLVGSVSQAVLETSPFPVLVVEAHSNIVTR